MSAKIFRIVDGGPGLGCSRVISQVKTRLRNNDIRAIAIVTVDRFGNVSTQIGGAEDGFMHHISSGVEILRMRVNDCYEK